MRAKRWHHAKVAAALAVTAGLLMAWGCQRFKALLYPDRCVLSERVIHPAMAVRLAVQGEAKSGEACCLRCAISYSLQTGKTVRIMWVTDYSTSAKIAADRAYYVTGSDIAPCVAPPMEATAGRRQCAVMAWDRCSPSSLPFASLAEAQAFQQAHGGRIETFSQVIGSSKVVASR